LDGFVLIKYPTKVHRRKLLNSGITLRNWKTNYMKHERLPRRVRNHFAQEDDAIVLHYSYACEKHDAHSSFILDPFGEKDTRHTDKYSSSWNEIFSILSPLMINEASERNLKDCLDNFIESKEKDRLKKNPDSVLRI